MFRSRPSRMHEVRREHGARHQLVRPAERRLPRVGQLQPRIRPLAEQRDRAGVGLVLRHDVRESAGRSGRSCRPGCGCRVWLSTLRTVPKPLPVASLAANRALEFV